LNWLDWLFIIIIGISAIKGLRSGFMAGVAGIAGLLGGIWAAVSFHGQLAAYLASQWGWDEKISGYLMSLAQTNNVDSTFISPSDVVSSIMPAISLSTGTVLDMVAFALIVIIVYVFLGGTLKLLAGATSRTIFSPFDKLAGGVLGLAKGILFASIILVIIFSLKIPLTLLSAGDGPGTIALAVQKSQLTPFLLNLISMLNLPIPVLNVNMAFALK